MLNPGLDCFFLQELCHFSTEWQVDKCRSKLDSSKLSIACLVAKPFIVELGYYVYELCVEIVMIRGVILDDKKTTQQYTHSILHTEIATTHSQSFERLQLVFDHNGLRGISNFWHRGYQISILIK